MSKTNYFNLIKKTEEYKSLMKLQVPFDDIMFYFNHVAIYSMRNDYKHRKRDVISIEQSCMTEKGEYGPALKCEDELDRYEEDVPIVDQISDPSVLGAILSLSPRRQVIVEMKVQGYSGVEIAEHLGISPPAVTKHLKVIREVLQPYLAQCDG